MPTKSQLTLPMPFNWPRKNVELPLVFKSYDIRELKLLDENVLFARKFDTKIDQKIFKNIELYLRLQ